MATIMVRPARVILGCLALYCGGQAIVAIVSDLPGFLADIQGAVRFGESIVRFVTG